MLQKKIKITLEEVTHPHECYVDYFDSVLYTAIITPDCRKLFLRSLFKLHSCKITIIYTSSPTQKKKILLIIKTT